MTDYLEQLLRQTQGEQEPDEGQPVPGLREEPGPGSWSERFPIPGQAGEPGPAAVRPAGWDERPPARPGGETGPAWYGGAGGAGAGWADGPAGKTVAGPWREQAAQRPPLAEVWAGTEVGAGGGLPAPAAPRPAAGQTGPAADGLRMLYRQVQQASWSGSAGQRPGVAVVRETAQPEQGLTVGQLDRAVRRDSRRYDGGMNIY